MLSAATPPLALQEPPGASTVNTPPQGEEATYDAPWAPRRCLQEGYDTEVPPPPDPRIRVSSGATRRAARVVATPSRRVRASPSPVNPKIEQVFTPDQYSPPPNATPWLPRRPHGHGHQAAPSHGLCPGAPRHHHQGRRPSIQDLDATSPATHRYPNQRDEWKGTAFRTPELPPASRPNRSAEIGLRQPILPPGARRARSCSQARDESGPATGRETSDGPQLGEGQPSDEGAPERRGEESKVVKGAHRQAAAEEVQPPP